MAKLYSLQLRQLGNTDEKRMHTTRLKHRLLARFPDMRAQSKGRDVLLVFDEDVGYALSKAFEQNSENDAVHVARAAQIVCGRIFEPNAFSGTFEKNCQEKSVPPLLLALVRMILESSSNKDQIRLNSTQAALSFAQILKYNRVKHMRKQADSSSSVRHSLAQETPVPTYIGLLLQCANA